MSAELKTLETNLDQIIKVCYENLPKLKIAADVEKHLMEYARASNKRSKAAAGLGQVKLKINKDKILDHDFNKALDYVKKLEVGVGTLNPKEDLTLKIMFVNGIRALPYFRQQVDNAAAELQCLKDNNQNFGNIFGWLDDLLAGKKSQPPDCPGIERLNSLGLILKEDSWKVLTGGLIRRDRPGCVREVFFNAANAFSDSMFELKKIFEENGKSLLSALPDYKQYAKKLESDKKELESLKNVAFELWKRTGSEGFVAGYIAPLEGGLIDSVQELQGEYQKMEQVLKAKKNRDNSKVLVAAKAFKTKPTKKTCCALIDLDWKNTSILNKKRRDALKKLKMAVENLPNDLLPKQ